MTLPRGLHAAWTLKDAMNNREILCVACGKVTLARAEVVYDGFRRIGERFVCTACGRRYPSREETPFVEREKTPTLFAAEDRPVKPRIFDDRERRRSCGWCRHFVVNPFGQRCGRTNRETEATDLCDHFEPLPEPRDPDPVEETAPKDPLSALFRD